MPRTLLARMSIYEMERQRALIEGASAGERKAGCELVATLTPIIRARAARVLARTRGRFGEHAARFEVDDLTQEIWVMLLERRAHALRSWRPQAGLSLENFVGLVAQRRAISILRDKRSSADVEEPTERVGDVRHMSDDPEVRASKRETLRVLGARLNRMLSPRARGLFDMLLVREEPLDQLSGYGMTHAALYAWRSRLSRLARNLVLEIET